MDDYGVSLGVPTAASPNAVGEKQQPNQQKKQEEQKKKKQDKKHSADSQDIAIISGQTLKPNNIKETKDDEPSGKGDFIDIQV
jgi:hypothetical protein